jgi:exonuclease SbcC
MGYKKLSLPKENDDFPDGLILISGRNSYGKSTILEGILFAFFGPKVFRGRNAASFITYGEERAEIYIYFFLDKTNYYIFRKWRRTGSVSSKIFKMDKNGVYHEIQKFNVNDFFEISPEQALNTVFVKQGEVEELANKRGAELREMIIDLFRLNIIDDALVFLEKESKLKKFNKQQLEKSRVPIVRIKEDINRIINENQEVKNSISERKKKGKSIELQLKDFPSDEIIIELEDLYTCEKNSKNKFLSYKKDFETKIKTTNLSLNDFTSLEKISNKINEINTRKNETEVKSQEFNRKKEATFKGLGIVKGKIDDIKKKIKKMEKSLQFKQTKEGKKIALCPTCQNELTKEHYDEIIGDFNKDLKIHQNKANKVNEIITNFDKKIGSFQDSLKKLNEDIIKFQTLKEDFVNLEKYETEYNDATKLLGDLTAKHQLKLKDSSLKGIKAISLEKEKLISEMQTINKEIREKEKKFQNNQDRLMELRNEIKKMEEIENKIGDLEIDIDHLNKAKEYVRRFVSEYMVVKRLVKNIAITTNKYIKNFTSGQYSDLILDLSGTRKTGLSLKIKDNFHGIPESIEVLSGGDRTALGMALRLAISELMSKIRPTKESPKKNPKIDFLLLDEPLAALDETRRERILKYLVKSKTFSQIFLITHTAIPSDIQVHKILVEKDHSTGISQAKFERSLLVPQF